MSRLEDALESGLRALMEGKSLEAIISDSPEIRPELEPLLRAAAAAKQAASREVRPDLKRRMRSRFLQRAAEMRERPPTRRQRVIPAFSRVAITLSLVTVLVLTSTGLVSASSRAIPGDQLYGVKRSWEDLRLLLSTQPSEQYLLESEFEQERLNEIEELLAGGRTASITFSGVIGRKQDGTWVVSGIPVLVNSTAMLPSGTIVEGQPVLVSGSTLTNGAVAASRISLLLPGAALPPLAPSAGDNGQHGAPEIESENERPDHTTSENPPTYTTYQFTGIVERLGQDTWLINQQQVRVDQATIVGSITVGSEIRFEGYYTPSGTFVATRIEATTNLRYDEGRDDGSGKTGGSDKSDDGSDSSDSGGDDSHDGSD